MAVRYVCDVCGEPAPARPEREIGYSAFEPAMLVYEGIVISIFASNEDDYRDNAKPYDLCRSCLVKAIQEGVEYVRLETKETAK